MRPMLRALLPAVVLALAAPAAHAQPLSVAQVAAPQINCVFSTSCSVTVNDHVSPLFGGGRLQSRTFQAQAGARAAGMHVYQYRVDLTAAAGAPTVTSLTVDFGPSTGTLDFDGAGGNDDVFVVTRGGLGSVGVVSATRSGRNVTFTFGPGLAGGTTSYFFGLVSRFAPGPVRARVTAGNETVEVEARAPVPGRGNNNSRPGGGKTGPMAAEDCIAYNTQALALQDEGANGWLLTDGRSRLLMLDDRADADRALALARRHTHQCFVGRDNTRPDRKRYIMQYWRGTTGATPAIPGEDCVSFNPATVAAVDRGSLGWRLEDGSHYMQLLDNEAEANRGLTVARATSGRMCFIGRDSSRSNRCDYIVQYWQ